MRTYDYEAGTDGSPLTAALVGTGAGNPLIDTGGSAIFSDDNPYQGNLSARFTHVGGTTGSLQRYSLEESSTILRFTYATNLLTDLTGGNNFVSCQLRHSGGAAGTLRVVAENGVPTLRLFAGSTDIGQIGSGTFAEDGTWYRISGEIDGVTGSFVFRLRDGDTDALIGSPLTGNNSAFIQTFASIQLGVTGQVGQSVTTGIDWVLTEVAGSGELPAPAPVVNPPTLDIERPAANIVDLRGSVSGDSSALTFPTPSHISGPVLTVSSLDAGLWLFSQDPDTASVYNVSVEQADEQTADDDVTIAALPQGETVNIAAPLRPLGAPPGTDWG